MEAISHAGAALGILAKDGVVLAAEKLVTSKLLDSMGSEKLYLIDDHIACVVSGITADANILVSQSRVAAQQYLLTYHEPMPVGRMGFSVSFLCGIL
jgi:20S proteasome subunit alpha 3